MRERENRTARGGGQLLLATLASLALSLCLAGSASAGEWVQVSCVNPDGSAAGSEGWSTMIAGGGYGSNADSSCGPGSPSFAELSTAAAVGVGSAETLFYTPPVGSRLTGGSVDVSLSAFGGGYNGSGTAALYSPNFAYDGSDVFFQCAAGLPPCTSAGPVFSGALALPTGRGGDLYVSAGCGGNPGAACNAGGSEGAYSSVHMYWAHLRLVNTATPSVEATSGTLLAGLARGVADLAFTATDRGGPGVYAVTVSADGQTLYSGTPDGNGGACAPVGSEAGALMFDASEPCRESEAVDLPLQTSALRDGTHTLRVTITDAAGNQSVVYDTAIGTLNAPVNLTPPALQAASGAAFQVQPGAWSVPAGAGTLAYAYEWQACASDGQGCHAIPGATRASYTPGASEQGLVLRALVTASDGDGQSTLASALSPPIASPVADLANGLAASEHATLTLTGPSRVTRSFAHRALDIRGQLLGSGGAPIADATLEVLSEQRGQVSPQVVGFTTTGAAGAFNARVAPGPSRVLTIAYRAFSADSSYTAAGSVDEAVQASVSLHVSPARIQRTGTIWLRGAVAGPLPPGGVSVELLVRYRGQWEPFRAPRTGPDGRFRVRYRFEGASGRFPFKALVVSGQAGFPYDGSASVPAIVRAG